MKSIVIGAALVLTVVGLIWMTMDYSDTGDKKDEKVINTRLGLK